MGCRAHLCRAHRARAEGGPVDVLRARRQGADDVEYATAEWVDWFNHRRLYEYCGDIPPVEAEALYYARNQAQQQLEPSHQ